MTVLMSPDMANFSGNVHGGAILKLLDQVAYSCASRYSGCYVVTLSVDQVMFLQPIHVGEMVSFLARGRDSAAAPDKPARHKPAKAQRNVFRGMAMFFSLSMGILAARLAFSNSRSGSV